MSDDKRQLEWMRGAKRDITKVPLDAREEMMQALDDLLAGEYPTGVKPLKGFASGTHEVVVDEDGDTYRAVVTVRFPKAVYVLHVFQKKSKQGVKTPQQHIELVRQRLRAAEAHYRAKYEKRQGE